MIFLYISIACLFMFIAINWLTKEDLTLSLFGLFLIVSLIPAVNVALLLLLIVVVLLEETKNTKITLLKGRK